MGSNHFQPCLYGRESALWRIINMEFTAGHGMIAMVTQFIKDIVMDQLTYLDLGSLYVVAATLIIAVRGLM